MKIQAIPVWIFYLPRFLHAHFLFSVVNASLPFKTNYFKTLSCWRKGKFEWHKVFDFTSTCVVHVQSKNFSHSE